MGAVTKLESTLLYFAQRFGRGLSRIELAKLAYLSDCEVFIKHRRTLNKVAYFREKHGPYNAAIPQALDRLAAENMIVITEEWYPDGKMRVNHQPQATAPDASQWLSTEECQVLDAVLETCKHMTFQEILDTAYNTAPMQVLLQKESEEGKLLIGHRLDLAALISNRKRFSKESLRAVLQAAPKINVGDDKEYAQELIDEWRALQPYRDAANSLG